MAVDPGLASLQRWMQAVIVHPGETGEALRGVEAKRQVPPSRVGEVLLPSKTLGPEERLAIYHGMYLVRMEEALASDYPGLKHFLGDDRFRDLVRDYVQAHPSRSYSLNPLGLHLPEFVADHFPGRHRAFLADLARLERAMATAFDADETPRIGEADIAAVPPEAWKSARLKTVAGFSLLSLRYPVDEYLQGVIDEVHDHPRPRLKGSWVAVYRRDYAVYRLSLSRPAHDLLADLAAGRPLGQAIARVQSHRRRVSEHELFRWFRDWVSVGIFSRIKLRTT
jgi:hypothetical protein